MLYDAGGWQFSSFALQNMKYTTDLEHELEQKNDLLKQAA